MTEASLMRRIMLALSRRCILFRNNIGAYKQGERWIEYGVCNPGGGDLLGWTEVEITPEMVGRKVAVFTSLEVKTDKGKPTIHQVRFRDAVKRAGGIAEIVRSEEEAEKTVALFSTSS